MSPDIRVLDTLRRFGVRFTIVGGHAVNVHGFTRITEDVDVVWLRSEEQEQKLLLALTELRAHYIGSEIDPATRIERTYPVTLAYIRSMHLMMVFMDEGFLDIFDYVPGFPDEDVNRLFESSVEVDGFSYASLAWLRKMKEAAGRPKDLLDLQKLPE